MKRILSICFIFCIIFTLLIGFSIHADAASTIEKEISGSVSKISYSFSENSEEIKIITAKTEILREFTLDPNPDCNNYRLCFEIKDAKINSNGYLDINNGSVVQIRYALKKDPQSVSIVVETKTKPQYTIAPSSDGKSLVLKLNQGTKSNTNSTTASTPKPSATPIPSQNPSTTQVPVSNTSGQSNSSINSSGIKSITQNGPVSWSIQNNTCVVKLDGVDLSQTNSSGRKPSIELREKEKILQITIPGKDPRFVEGILSGNGVVHGFLINYNEKIDSNIIRITYMNQVSFTHGVSGGSSIIKINGIGSGQDSTGVSSPAPITTPKPSSTPTPSPSPAPTPVSGVSRGDADRTSSVNVNYSADTVTVTSPVVSGYKIYRLGSPSRIVIELPGIVVASQQQMPSGYLYQKASLSQLNTTTAKIVLETSGMPQWTVSESAGKLLLKLSQSGTTNIEGGSNDGQIALRLKGANIVDKYRANSSKILSENNQKDGTYAFMLPTDLVSFGQGSANIDDVLLKSVTTLTTPENSFLLLNKKNAAHEFKIIESSDENELLIVVNNTGGSSNTNPVPSTPNISSQKLVVLDPGHGGSDPGGTIGSYYEKKYNLDISLRAEAILKQRGINVIMTRRTDVFVSLDDRCKIANDNNAALFVSVHNNIMPNPATKGAMALYYPTSYKGKDYARIFLSNLTSMGLGGMGSAGLSARGDLVVLKRTNMPAVLLEIACMTNQDDLNLLNSEAFIQKSAENIANSITQVLGTMN